MYVELSWFPIISYVHCCGYSMIVDAKHNRRPEGQIEIPKLMIEIYGYLKCHQRMPLFSVVLPFVHYVCIRPCVCLGSC